MILSHIVCQAVLVTAELEPEAVESQGLDFPFPRDAETPDAPSPAAGLKNDTIIVHLINNALFRDVYMIKII